MAIIIGSEEHKYFTRKFFEYLDKHSDSKNSLFFYKKIQFKGFSVGDMKIGEHKISFPKELIDELRNDDNVILLVRGVYQHWNSDAMFTELCQLVDMLKCAKSNMKGSIAKKLCIVLPREGYVKQDHVFKDDEGNLLYGESITIDTQRRVLKNLGADLLVTLYPHDFRPENDKEGWIRTASSKDDPSKVLLDFVETKDISILQDWKNFAWAVNPIHHIAKHFKDNNIKIDVVVAPDKGAFGFSKFIADGLGVDCVYIDSHRSRKDANIITSKGALKQDISGKSVLIPDDFILVGGKTKHAIDFVRPYGEKAKWPKEIHIAVIHGEMTGNTYHELMSRDIKLYCSNSIENPASRIDIIGILAERVNELFLR